MTNSNEVDQQVGEQAIAENTAPRARKVLVLIGIAFLLFVGITTAAAIIAYQSVKDQADDATSLAQRVREACADPKTDTESLGDICPEADAVVEDAPDSVDVTEGPKGDPGEPGPPPSDEQVEQAVDLYCSINGCRGADGDNATASQVAAAVASYCDARGRCRGPAGGQGPEGQEGPTGPQGPPPTGEQVAAAVAGYCSTRNECRGPEGPKGEPGDPGQPGDTVQGGSCEFDGVGTLRITIQTSNGPETFECVGTPGNEGGIG